jgi:hypothetical protein
VSELGDGATYITVLQLVYEEFDDHHQISQNDALGLIENFHICLVLLRKKVFVCR